MTARRIKINKRVKISEIDHFRQRVSDLEQRRDSLQDRNNVLTNNFKALNEDYKYLLKKLADLEEKKKDVNDNFLHKIMQALIDPNMRPEFAVHNYGPDTRVGCSMVVKDSQGREVVSACTGESFLGADEEIVCLFNVENV